ncbi:MAG: peptidylprolyl isomerase [Bacteroidetes bacterium]|nr:peptidylprolyl isomerase [Bacteroidota bacterium]
MRSLAPAFIIGVGVIFVLFMIISDSNIMEVFGLRTNNVGSINGVKITYQEFNKAMENERENIKQQSGKDVPDEDNDQFRDQVWDALITQTLLSQEIKKYGISVSDQEIRDIILSPNPPEFLKRSFIDSTGKFNRQLYLNALYDPKNSQALVQAEDYIRQNQLTQKLQSLLLASITVSEAELKRKFIDQNTKVNDQYALVSLTEFPDANIKVSDEDLKNYYNQHLDQFEIKPQRKLKYVLFPTAPSSEDSSNIKLNLENIISQTQSDTTTFKTLVENFSSSPYSKDTLSISAFPASISNQIMSAKPGSIVGPAASNEGFVLYHVIGTVPSKDEMVRASHILINQYGDDAKNLDEAMKIYDQLQKGADFATLAKQNSKDPGSAIKGGDLGWFGKGQMVPEFEKAVFSGKVGVVQKPIKTNYGYHIIKVTGKSDTKYVVEKLVNPIKASAGTKDQLLSNAKDFSYLANKDGFDKEAKLMNYKLLETPTFTKDAYFVPGIGVGKSIVDFAFKNSINSISDALRSSSGYVVVEVSDVVNEGVKTFDQVKDQIKPEVIKEKKYELAKKEAEDLKSKIGDDLTKATTIDSKVIVNQTGDFSNSGSIPTIGVDYNFASKSLDLPINKVSGPIKGERGYYLIKVLSRTPFDSSAFSIQRNSIRDNIIQQKKNTFFSEWLAKLKKDADIVDNRSQFYGQ